MPTEGELPAEDLPTEALRRALTDLFEPRPVLYWVDFLAAAGCFYGGFAIAAARPLVSPLTWIAGLVSVFGLYRAIIFIHELAHLAPGSLRAFRIAWHVVCGIPLLAPAFLYGSHVDHHRRPAYGTLRDGEYLPWGTPGHRLSILGFLLTSFAALPVAVLRFGLLAPLSWPCRRLRAWITVSASSLIVHPHYRRAPPGSTEDRVWRLQEAVIFIYLTAVAGGLLTQRVPMAWLVQLYATFSAAMLLNGLRTLAAHRYRSAGRPLTATEQLLDSINYPQPSWLTPLWAPVGLRFHAVHHLFAGIPYHNLGAAHARIVRLVPPDSPYHRSEGRSLVSSLCELWRAARAEPDIRLRGGTLRRGDAG
jgi:fatty acid desaturase